jgi:hypothetical protein
MSSWWVGGFSVWWSKFWSSIQLACLATFEFNFFSTSSNICRAHSSDSSVGSWQKNEIQTANLDLLLLSQSFYLFIFFRLDFLPLFQFPAETVCPLSFWPNFALDRFFNSLLNPVRVSVIFFFFTRFLLSLQASMTCRISWPNLSNASQTYFEIFGTRFFFFFFINSI